MKRTEYEAMNLDELIDWACYYLDSDVTTKEILLDFAKVKIDDDNIYMAIHILKAVYESVEAYNGYYLYDYNMGTLQKPTPVTCKEDLEHLIDFEEDD